MIIHARVDERLIHGQVAAVWSNVVNAERLYVVNDSAWNDEMVLGALQLAKPAGKKLTVSSIRRAIVNFKEYSFCGIGTDVDRILQIVQIQHKRKLIFLG